MITAIEIRGTLVIITRRYAQCRYKSTRYEVRNISDHSISRLRKTLDSCHGRVVPGAIRALSGRVTALGVIFNMT